MAGFILINREIMDHWVFRDPHKFKFWLTLLFLANFTDKTFNIGNKIIEIKRGSFITSIFNLSQITLKNNSTIRSWLRLLSSDNMIEIISTTKYTQITICNYEYWQSLQQTKRKQNANKTQTNSTQLNKENTDKEDIGQRKILFKESLQPFLEKYGKEMLNDFYFYWSEETQDKKSLKFELQKTWSISGRLRTWKKNDSKFNKA